MIFRSIGYKGHPLKDIPFDERGNIIPNQEGRVLDPTTNTPLARLYVAGWIKRGPSGVIGTNKPDAVATVRAMLQDVEQGQAPDGLRTGEDAIPTLLTQKGIRYVTFADWKHLDRLEVENGKKRDKPREKITTLPEMLAAREYLCSVGPAGGARAGQCQ